MPKSCTVPLPVSHKFIVVCHVMARSIIIVLSKHQVHMIANLNFWTCVKGSRGLLTFLLWDLCSYTPSEQEASLQVSCSS